MARIGALAIFGWLFAGAAAAQRPADSVAVAAVRAQWLQATRHMDLAGMVAPLAGDVSLPLADKPTLMGKEAVQAYWDDLNTRIRSSGASVNPLVLQLGSFQQSGPYAVETGTYGPGTGRMRQVVGTFTFVYRHDREGHWRIAWLSLWPNRVEPQPS